MSTTESPSLVSPTQLERLRSGLSAWRAAESAAAEAAEKLSTAKSDRDSKTESFRESVDEIPAEADPTEEQEHRIASLAKDLRRSEQKFTECDREKRSRADHEKKVGARFLKVAMEIFVGQQVASAMHSRGYAKHLPEQMLKLVGKTVKAPPDVKPEKAEKPESDSEE